jgi:hypothetical protein
MNNFPPVDNFIIRKRENDWLPYEGESLEMVHGFSLETFFCNLFDSLCFDLCCIFRAFHVIPYDSVLRDGLHNPRQIAS